MKAVYLPTTIDRFDAMMKDVVLNHINKIRELDYIELSKFEYDVIAKYYNFKTCIYPNGDTYVLWYIKPDELLKINMRLK